MGQKPPIGGTVGSNVVGIGVVVGATVVVAAVVFEGAFEVTVGMLEVTTVVGVASEVVGTWEVMMDAVVGKTVAAVEGTTVAIVVAFVVVVGLAVVVVGGSVVALVVVMPGETAKNITALLQTFVKILQVIFILTRTKPPEVPNAGV